MIVGEEGAFMKESDLGLQATTDALSMSPTILGLASSIKGSAQLASPWSSIGKSCNRFSSQEDKSKLLLDELDILSLGKDPDVKVEGMTRIG